MAKLSKNQQKHIRRTTPTLGGASNKRSAPKSNKSLERSDEKLSALTEGKLLTPVPLIAEATEVVATKVGNREQGTGNSLTEQGRDSEPENRTGSEKLRVESAPPVLQELAREIAEQEDESNEVVEAAPEPEIHPETNGHTNGVHYTNGASKIELNKSPKLVQPIQPASVPTKLFSQGRPGLSLEKPAPKTAAILSVAGPQEAPRTFWSHTTTQTMLWFVGFVIAAAILGKESSLNLTSAFVSHNLSVHAPSTQESEGAPATPFSPFGAGVSATPPAVAEESPPLPPPRRPGESNTPFNGQKIEESCVKKEGERCVQYSLDSFYAELAKTIRQEPKAIVRVTHFGDSIIAADYISSRVRELMQNNFGDSGSGFIYLSKPSRWYYREGVKHDAGSAWDTRTITSDKKSEDRLYGLGGASFEALGPGAESSFATTDSANAKFGKSVSRFVVHYLEQPGGGEMTLSIDGQVVEKISTKSAEKKSVSKVFEVPDGAHKISVKASSARVRAFGVAMERDEPGVVYDSLGLVSGSAKALGQIDAAHWQDELRQRNPNLLIFTFGTNEVGYTSVSEKWAKDYEEKYKTLLMQVREALPNSACLLMSPPDSNTNKLKSGVMTTWPALPRLVEAQRSAAMSAGCAYWDTYTWMGGKNSMAAWVKKGLGQNDYAHPTKKGAAKIGDAFFEALMAGYDEYAIRNQIPIKPK